MKSKLDNDGSMVVGCRRMTNYRIRFQDPIMQRHYENLIKNGYHWKTAESKTLKTFKEYDNADC